MDAVACDYWLFDDKEKWIKRMNAIQKPIGCGIIFEKEKLIDVGLYNEKFLMHEELELMQRFKRSFKVFRLEMPLYRYRMHEKNMTKDAKRVKYFKKLLGESNRKEDK